MSQRAALRATGRAGGVHNGREVVTTGCGTYLLQLLIAYLGGASAQGIEVAILNDPAVLQLHGLLGRGGEFLSLRDARQKLLILNEDGGSLRVGERPRRLCGCVGLVHRHGDGARVPNREVNDGPLEAGAAHNAHTVTRADARSNHALS